MPDDQKKLSLIIVLIIAVVAGCGTYYISGHLGFSLLIGAIAGWVSAAPRNA